MPCSGFAGRRQDSRIFVLLEHKSHVAPGTPLYLARYMLNICARRMVARPAPGTGQASDDPADRSFFDFGEWTVPLSLVEIIDATEGVDDPFRGFVFYSLRDLHRLGPWQLARHPEFQAVPVAFWIIFEQEIFPELIW